MVYLATLLARFDQKNRESPLVVANVQKTLVDKYR